MKKNPKKTHNIKFAFFGTPELAVTVLDELEKAGLVPALIVTAPDTQQGRGLVLMPPPVKTWGLAHDIPVLQPSTLDAAFLNTLKSHDFDVFIVAAYGKILPQELLEIPVHGVLNVHPSLLPRLRGPSPIQSAIVNDERETGVTIMQVDADMDHGPIVAQKKVDTAPWPPSARTLGETLMHAGGALLAKMLPLWVAKEIEAHPQNHDVATHCPKFAKEDGLIDLSADAYKNLLKIRGLDSTIGTYTFFERNGKRLRVSIVSAHIDNDKLVIDRLVPEGKREMDFAEFIRSGAKSV